MATEPGGTASGPADSHTDCAPPEDDGYAPPPDDGRSGRRPVCLRAD